MDRGSYLRLEKFVDCPIQLEETPFQSRLCFPRLEISVFIWVKSPKIQKKDFRHLNSFLTDFVCLFLI
jgi:hypothetical protein